MVFGVSYSLTSQLFERRISIPYLHLINSLNTFPPREYTFTFSPISKKSENFPINSVSPKLAPLRFISTRFWAPSDSPLVDLKGYLIWAIE